MNLGSYNIETYYVIVNGVTETRQRILYTGVNGIDFFVERYNGSIRNGYTGSNTIFKNLTFNSIKNHIVGESIVINDNNLSPKALIYLSISSIESVQRNSDIQLIIVDTQVDPITLEFISKFDCDQAYSILTHLLQDPLININSLGSDIIPPQIFFNEYFFSIPITLDPTSGVGPFSSIDGNNFRVDINLSSYQGPNPITKKDLISGLIYDIVDNRDKNILLIEDDILIYKDVISNQSLVDNISVVGNYIVNIVISDLGQNQANINILISVL
jgi:hypothetical protein